MGKRRKSIVYHPPIRKSSSKPTDNSSRKASNNALEVPKFKKTLQGWSSNISPNVKRRLLDNLRTPEPTTSEVKRKTSEVKRKTSEVKRKTPEVKRKTPEVKRKTPETSLSKQSDSPNFENDLHDYSDEDNLPPTYELLDQQPLPIYDPRSPRISSTPAKSNTFSRKSLSSTSSHGSFVIHDKTRNTENQIILPTSSRKSLSSTSSHSSFVIHDKNKNTENEIILPTSSRKSLSSTSSHGSFVIHDKTKNTENEIILPTSSRKSLSSTSSRKSFVIHDKTKNSENEIILSTSSRKSFVINDKKKKIENKGKEKKRKKPKAITFDTFVRRKKSRSKGPTLATDKLPKPKPKRVKRKLKIIDDHEDENDIINEIPNEFIDDDNGNNNNNNNQKHKKKKIATKTKNLIRQLNENKIGANYKPLIASMPTMGGDDENIPLTFSHNNLHWRTDNNNLKHCECLSTRTFKMGFLKISPHGLKEQTLNTISWLTFVALTDGVTLTVYQQTKPLDACEVFHIPPYAEYGLENMSDITILLFYYVNFAC